jgi:cobalamin biosynthesis protein CobW
MNRIPATVITGFLGAGKTTLIRHLLENAGNRRIALIVNEFGDVGVDGELLRACGNPACGEEDIVELANGCICCTVADDFIPTMTRLIERPQPPDHILIETSGLALPQPLIRAFNWPDIRAAVTVDGVITVVDGPAVRDGLFAADPGKVEALRRSDASLDHESPLHELFEDQLRAADLVVLHKADLLSPEEQGALIERIAAGVRPGVAVVPVSHGRIAPEALLGLQASVEDDVDNRPTHHELAGEADHDHDDFVSFAFTLPEAASRERLLTAIRKLMEDFPALLRLKGFAALSRKRARLAVQAVGPRVDGWFDRPFAPGEERITRLVAIGLKGLNEAAIRDRLSRALSE